MAQRATAHLPPADPPAHPFPCSFVGSNPQLERVLFDLFESSCLVCLDGGPKCQRCQHPDVPHQ